MNLRPSAGNPGSGDDVTMTSENSRAEHVSRARGEKVAEMEIGASSTVCSTCSAQCAAPWGLGLSLSPPDSLELTA